MGVQRFTDLRAWQACYAYKRSSLMESQNHLIDAVDKGYITEEIREEHNRLAETALEEHRTPNRTRTRTEN